MLNQSALAMVSQVNVEILMVVYSLGSRLTHLQLLQTVLLLHDDKMEIQKDLGNVNIYGCD